MKAGEIMTRDVVTAGPLATRREIAALLLKNGISALPIVDAAGTPIGMVSEGDLISRSDADREARRDWWLALLAEGEALSERFLASLRAPGRTAGEIMSTPVVTVEESADVEEIARLLASYRIKRVPIVRDRQIVGIVSRADVLRVLAAEEAGRTASS